MLFYGLLCNFLFCFPTPFLDYCFCSFWFCRFALLFTACALVSLVMLTDMYLNLFCNVCCGFMRFFKRDINTFSLLCIYCNLCTIFAHTNYCVLPPVCPHSLAPPFCLQVDMIVSWRCTLTCGLSFVRVLHNFEVS